MEMNWKAIFDPEKKHKSKVELESEEEKQEQEQEQEQELELKQEQEQELEQEQKSLQELTYLLAGARAGTGARARAGVTPRAHSPLGKQTHSTWQHTISNTIPNAETSTKKHAYVISAPAKRPMADRAAVFSVLIMALGTGCLVIWTAPNLVRSSQLMAANLWQPNNSRQVVASK